MKLPDTPTIPIIIVLVAVILQVFVPALFDLVISLAIAAGGFMLGRISNKVVK